IQCIIKALRPIYEKLPKTMTDFFMLEKAVIKDFQWLLSNYSSMAPDSVPATEEDWRRVLLTLLEGNQGTLVLARTAPMGERFFAQYGKKVEIAFGKVKNPKGYHTLLMGAETKSLQNWWENIVLLDGELISGETEAIEALCPKAKVWTMKKSDSLVQLTKNFAMEDEPLRGLYKSLRSNLFFSLQEIAEKNELTQGQVIVGLESFAQMKLLRWSNAPFSYQIVPPTPCNIGDAPLLAAFRQQQKQGR
ncbi:MAG: hypothetical protein GX786_00490, partial [Clostridiales bacterium]|nr:hypothetical protein [Clostridiales bacterium]